MIYMIWIVRCKIISKNVFIIVLTKKKKIYILINLQLFLQNLLEIDLQRHYNYSHDGLLCNGF